MSELQHNGQFEFGGMRSQAANVGEVFAVLERLARTDLAVALVGETGSGKSRLARAVHAASSRSGMPLVVLDYGSSAASPEAHIDLERGAPARSVSNLSEAIGDAHGGTLLIDDAGELPLELQARLVRVWECDRRRIGEDRNAPLDVRIIVTSHRELDVEVTAGRFRRDLYFRLAAAVVRVPPIRDRRVDIPQLIEELLQSLGRGDVTVAPEAVEYLRTRHWLGNVRELKNALACALALLDGDKLELRNFERVGLATEASALDHLSLAGISLEQLEKTAIRQTLERVRGNKVRAAKLLGIAVSTLYEKLKRLSIE